MWSHKKVCFRCKSRSCPHCGVKAGEIWFRDPALCRRGQTGLNKGEARNSLAHTVFLHRLGEIRDRKLENQSYRASGLTLLTVAISLWNTVYMEIAVDALKRKGLKINEQLLSHLSPPGWKHINLTGDYIGKSNRIPVSFVG